MDRPMGERPVGMTRPELIQVADTVARDKNIDREEVFLAMEQAIQRPDVPNTVTNTISARPLIAATAKFGSPATSKWLRWSKTRTPR